MSPRPEATEPRRYPVIPEGLPEPTRPISFVTVGFSEELRHNLEISPCVGDPRHELIVIDNRADVFFATLGQALNAGIDRAQHDLVVLVHEDVVLPERWDAQMEVSLAALGREDPEWAVAGAAGWDEDGIRGHYSAPRKYADNLGDEPFVPIARIDEMIVVLRKSRPLRPDPDLPSIHNIGRDLVAAAEQLGGRGYVIDAPVIHKYADAQGRLIQGAAESPKIVNRRTPPYIHFKECSDEYLDHKWADHVWLDRKTVRDGGRRREPPTAPVLPTEQEARLRAPLILLASSGTEPTESAETLEMLPSIYRALYRKLKCPSEWQRSLIVPDLQAGAASLLEAAGWPERWAFALPESRYLLPELAEAFPDAAWVFPREDPLTLVRGDPQSARLDNEIGRATVPLAYDAAGLDRARILTDDDLVRRARTIAHELDLVLAFRGTVPTERWSEADAGRAQRTADDAPAAEVRAILEPVRRALGYS